MKEEWVLPYIQCSYHTEFTKNDYDEYGHIMTGRPMYIRMKGNISCSKDLHIGLVFGTSNPRPDFSPVLFVIGCRNYNLVRGMWMNNEAYTSYPAEGEILMMEGCRMYVLSVDKDVLITNAHASFSSYNGQRLTVINLFHPS